jgi:hypothetical protein
MSKVDWSLAPEGATHYNQNNRMFYVLDGDHYKFYCTDGELSYGGLIGEYLGMEERPKPAWSGPQDGLPPVGMHAEIKRSPNWTTVEVIAIHDGRAICAIPCLEGDFEYAPYEPSELRPIKTPQQLAAEQRETAIREIMDIADVDCRVTAGRLVDAGFKREVV